MINTYSDLDNYSISAIGDRPKVINDSNVKSIYFRNVPNLIFTTYEQLNTSDYRDKTGYVFMFLDGENNGTKTTDFTYFSISAQGKSAKDKIDEMLYNHSYCTESINISAIPIYYLEPNTLISVQDE